MKIKWLGHSCFLMTTGDGTRLVTDPFNEQVGYALPHVEADIVTVSHQHGDHNYTDAITGKYSLYSKAGVYSERGVDIKGVQTQHDDKGGSQRGSNVIFRFLIDGISVCHCGDLGHILTGEQLSEIGEVDVLMVPVGSVFTVDAEGAGRIVEQLKPEIVIPMHYKTEALSFNLDGLEKFTSRYPGSIRNLGKQELELEKGSLGQYSGIVVPSYK